VTVQHPNGPATLADAFTYDPAAPAITTVDPDHGPQDGNTVVTISGPGLGAATGVEFGGVAGTAVTPAGPDAVTVTTPAGGPGAVPVRVLLPSGPVVADDAYTYDADEPMTIDWTDPTWSYDPGGIRIRIGGQGIGDATGVDFGGVLGTGLQRIDDDTISVIVPQHDSGVVDLTVFTPRGPVVRFAAFRFVAAADPAPTATALSPYNGPALGGTLVTITGTGLLATTGVTFGGVAGTGLTIVDDTTIRVVAPAHAVGAVDVVVTTATGDAAPITYLYTDSGVQGGGSGPSSASVGGLASTGVDSSGGIFGALAAIVVGAAAVMIGARRRRLR
jgi:hypothetical protein